MPEGEKDDGLYGEKLEDGVIRSKHLFCGEVEEEKSIESKTDAGVVDQSNVEISSVNPEHVIQFISTFPVM